MIIPPEDWMPGVCELFLRCPKPPEEQMKKTYTRLEINQMVRRNLQANCIDLTQVNYSSSLRTIRLYGRLVKNTGKDLVIKEIENIMRVLQAIPGIMDITFDLDNWNISAGSITPKGSKKKDEKKKEENAHKEPNTMPDDLE